MTRLLRARHDRRGSADEGMSLVELLVAMMLTLVVGAILITAVTGTHRLFRITDDEATGQTDIRTTIERLGRDIRNARSLDAGANDSQLVLWIDSNSDYKKQTATEVVTWSLQPGLSGEHLDVTRTVGSSTSRTAQFVISLLAFCYKVDAEDGCLTIPVGGLDQATADSVRVVTSDIEYDANRSRGQSSRRTNFTERMRNVA
jgi:type II secretory pathway pseudopilin PulG